MDENGIRSMANMGDGLIFTGMLALTIWLTMQQPAFGVAFIIAGSILALIARGMAEKRGFKMDTTWVKIGVFRR